MKLSDEDKQKIVEDIATCSSNGEITGDFDPVIMVDRRYNSCPPEVILTSEEGFKRHALDNQGTWDIRGDVDVSVFDDGETQGDICFLETDVFKSFHVTKESEPEFIDQCKQAIQLGRL